jgi:hypothetical protein
MNPGTSSIPTDLDGLRSLMALITSESETGAKGKIIIIIIIIIINMWDNSHQNYNITTLPHI